MARRKGMLVAGLVILLFLAGFLAYELIMVQRVCYRYEPAGHVLKNPMMGYAPSADYLEAVGDNTLVYVDVTWRELEPEEGFYDFASIEEENYLSLWRENGKKVVFRFICDLPEDEEHMDIPDWLYEKTGDGTFYDCSYGKGYSPNYANQTFIAYHERAICALGEEYGQDSFFCYIELGSLGHWGEWHVNYASGIERFPDQDICRQYVMPYLEAFPHAKLLMRRPFSFVEEYGMGVYNDMTGEPEDTADWLDWIYNGGTYDEAQKPIKLSACKDIWDKFPVGGEFTSSLSMKELLTTNQEQTISLLQQSHMTFIGPMCPIANREEVEYPEEVSEILKNIGYRYGVTKLRIRHDMMFSKMVVTIRMKNYGVAPMYAAWPVYLYLIDENGVVLERYQTEINLAEITQGETSEVKVVIDGNHLNKEIPLLAVGIENPETGEPEVLLDMEAPLQDGKYLLNDKDYLLQREKQ